MIYTSVDKKDVKQIAHVMSKKLIKQPLFMFFCQDITKREAFIYDYFRYYIPEWSKYDTLFMNDDKSVIISMVDPKTFEYKFRGPGAHSLKRNKTSSTIFMHRENLEDIYDILVPPEKDTRIIHIYAQPEKDSQNIVKLVKEVIKFADENNLTILYDTFSRKYINFMLSQGLPVAYQKQFLNTQYIETIMTYNL